MKQGQARQSRPAVPAIGVGALVYASAAWVALWAFAVTVDHELAVGGVYGVFSGVAVLAQLAQRNGPHGGAPAITTPAVFGNEVADPAV